MLTDPDMLATQPDASLLLAIWESPADQQDIGGDDDANSAIPASRTVGLCALDAATGMFRLGQFTDDGLRSKLRSTLAHLRPVSEPPLHTAVRVLGGLRRPGEREQRGVGTFRLFGGAMCFGKVKSNRSDKALD